MPIHRVIPPHCLTRLKITTSSLINQRDGVYTCRILAINDEKVIKADGFLFYFEGMLNDHDWIMSCSTKTCIRGGHPLYRVSCLCKRRRKTRPRNGVQDEDLT
jgi:hypothetical protein